MSLHHPLSPLPPLPPQLSLPPPQPSPPQPSSPLSSPPPPSPPSPPSSQPPPPPSPLPSPPSPPSSPPPPPSTPPSPPPHHCVTNFESAQWIVQTWVHFPLVPLAANVRETCRNWFYIVDQREQLHSRWVTPYPEYCCVETDSRRESARPESVLE